MPKGELRKPNDYYKNIIHFLKTTDKKSFTAKEISDATGVPLNPVEVFMARNYKRKLFLRSQGPGTGSAYQYTVLALPSLQSSKGSVADAVWEILCNTNDPLTIDMINRKANLKRRAKFKRPAVSTLVSRLYKVGMLEKTENEFLLKGRFRKQKRPILKKTARTDSNRE